MRVRVALIKNQGCSMCDAGVERWREDWVHFQRAVWVHVVKGQDFFCVNQRDAPERIADGID